MAESPPKLGDPPFRSRLFREDGITFDTPWIQWFDGLYRRVGGELGRPIIGSVAWFETTVGQADLASAGTVTLLDALSGEQWKIREIYLSGDGTNFSGGGGDRLLSVSDGAATWTVVPAATLQSLAAARWGDTGVPFPATAAHFMQASAAGTDITAQYSGGAADYTAGSLTLALQAERVA